MKISTLMRDISHFEEVLSNEKRSENDLRIPYDDCLIVPYDDYTISYKHNSGEYNLRIKGIDKNIKIGREPKKNGVLFLKIKRDELLKLGFIDDSGDEVFFTQDRDCREVLVEKSEDMKKIEEAVDRINKEMIRKTKVGEVHTLELRTDEKNTKIKDITIDNPTPQELMQKAHEVVEKAKKHDAVNHPSHYNQGKVECIDALESATINKQGIEAVCVANVIKYLWRYESKNGLEDVKKAKWYLDRLIKELEK